MVELDGPIEETSSGIDPLDVLLERLGITEIEGFGKDQTPHEYYFSNPDELAALLGKKIFDHPEAVLFYFITKERMLRYENNLSRVKLGNLSYTILNEVQFFGKNLVKALSDNATQNDFAYLARAVGDEFRDFGRKLEDAFTSMEIL